MNDATNAERDGVQIDLQKLLLAWLKKWWLILLCAAVAAAGTLYYTMNYVTPLYRASVQIYVNNSSADERVDYISGSNLTASQQLVATYVNMIRSDTVLRKVAEALNKPDITANYIRDEMTTSQVQNTVMFNVYISDADPHLAAAIANTIADIAPAEIAEFVEGSSTKIVDYARIPQSPYTPSYTKNAAIGAIVGALVAIIIVTLQFLMDVRIKDEEDLTALFNLPILGQIPYIDLKNPNRKSSGYRSEGYTSEKS